jgi:hypothetical protein
MSIGFKVLAHLVALLLCAGCWEDTRVHREGEVIGFVVGASKRHTFDVAMLNQREGRIRDLQLIDEPYETYEKKYKGDPISADDFLRVAESNQWHTGLPGCNCWLRLRFENDVLYQVEEHEWTGPTK